jgi:hypothetical protein
VARRLRTQRANSPRVVQLDRQREELWQSARKERRPNAEDDAQAFYALGCALRHGETLEERGQHGIDDGACTTSEEDAEGLACCSTYLQGCSSSVSWFSQPLVRAVNGRQTGELLQPSMTMYSSHSSLQGCIVR